jgi:hypothetical protein
MTAWNETTEGAALNAAWAQLQYAYQTALPAHNTSLINLSNRPIQG